MATGSYKLRLLLRRFLFSCPSCWPLSPRQRWAEYVSTVSGNLICSPAGTGLTKRGVTTTSSSSVDFRVARLRNRLPTIGMSPSPRILVERLEYAIVDQSGDGEAFAVLQDHFGFGLARGDGGNQKALQRHRVGIVERGDGRRDFQMNAALSA